MVDTPATDVRRTAAQRRNLPDFRSVAASLADEHKVCRRPIPMRAEDRTTLAVSYVGSPCKATIASTCPACAEKNRHLRQTQCREGWHLDHEPVRTPNEPTEEQKGLLRARSDLFAQYQNARADDDTELALAIREIATSLDVQLRESGFRGRLPAFDAKPKTRRTRSTKRRDDVPDLPRRKVAKTTIGQQYAGRFRPSMFVTLTLDSYGRVRADGAPADPDTYDYTRAARDIVHFAALFDRWVQNLRRAVGWNVQYWGTVEPQRRGAPHIHLAIRGAVSHEMIRAVTAATYKQIWWPHHDREVYSGDRMPVWNPQVGAFTDPDTGQPLTTWTQALDVMDTVDELEPAHVVRFGAQVDSKGILGGSEEAHRHIGYLTKYLTKSIGEVIEPKTTAAAVHYDRLHTELQHTPCSKSCPVWFRYGIVPHGATEKTVPGRCKGKAHRRDTLGLPGRRVLDSRKWSNKDLPDHKHERAEFVRQTLAEVGIVKPDRSRWIITPVENGDKNVPPRDHLIMTAISQRITWHAEYTRALLAAKPPGTQENSAILQAA
ncbi:replication initiator [Nocardia sp. R16R-3T]